ncbi:MAG: hypothetical protein QOG68_2033 [Solirubrobacteraceae bacterium]|nr:hypothetical protein [Solirubrobacteraceae bacterium]
MTSYSAIVAPIAALSESPSIGMCLTRSHPSTTSAASPVRSAPITSVPTSSGHSGSPPRATSAMRGSGSSATSVTRATGIENTAPIDARTALGPNGSAVSGPMTTDAAPNASAPRRIVPTLPGSLMPHSATASGPAAAAQRSS